MNSLKKLSNSIAIQQVNGNVILFYNQNNLFTIVKLIKTLQKEIYGSFYLC